MSEIQGFKKDDVEREQKLHADKRTTLLYHVTPQHPKYSLLVIDSAKETVNLPSAVFVVPQGSENDYYYASNEGNEELADQISARRLILVFIDPHYEVPNLKSIIEELGKMVKQILPEDLKTIDTPILTAEEGVGNRKLLFEKKSEFNGMVHVEEIENEDKTITRRLKFDGFRNTVQSEAVVVDGQLDVEKSVEASPYLAAIREGLSFFWSNHNDLPFRIVVVGAGGCTLSLGIKKTIPESRIVNVDIDPVVVEAAEKYFFATNAETTKVLTMNGIDYLNRLMKKAQESMVTNAVHCIIIDVDNKSSSDDQLSGPPPEFLEQRNVLAMAKSIFPANDKAITPPVIIFNIVARNKDIRVKTVSNLCKWFRQLYVWQGGEDINCVAFCFPHPIRTFDINPDKEENKVFADFLKCLTRMK